MVEAVEAGGELQPAGDAGASLPGTVLPRPKSVRPLGGEHGAAEVELEGRGRVCAGGRELEAEEAEQADPGLLRLSHMRGGVQRGLG